MLHKHQAQKIPAPKNLEVQIIPYKVYIQHIQQNCRTLKPVCLTHELRDMKSREEEIRFTCTEITLGCSVFAQSKNVLFQTQQPLQLKSQTNLSILAMKQAPKGEQLSSTIFMGPGKPPNLYIHIQAKQLYLYGFNWKSETETPKDLVQVSVSFHKQLFQHAKSLNKTQHPSGSVTSR